MGVPMEGIEQEKADVIAILTRRLNFNPTRNDFNENVFFDEVRAFLYDIVCGQYKDCSIPIKVWQVNVGLLEGIIKNKKVPRLCQYITEACADYMSDIDEQIKRMADDTSLDSFNELLSDVYLNGSKLVAIFKTFDDNLSKDWEGKEPRLDKIQIGTLLYKNFYETISKQEEIDSIIFEKLFKCCEHPTSSLNPVDGRFKSVIDSLIGIDFDGTRSLYKKFFEIRFIECRSLEIDSLSKLWKEDRTTANYLLNVIEFIKAEESLCMNLPSETRHILKTTLYDSFVISRSDYLIESEDTGVLHLLQNSAVDHLKLLFSVVKQVKEVELLMIQKICGWIETNLLDRLTYPKPANSKERGDIIMKILLFFNTIDNIMVNVFENNVLIRSKINDFITTVLKKKTLDSKLMAGYADHIARVAAKKGEAWWRDEVNSFFKLFVLISDKTPFKHFFIQDQCQRVDNDKIFHLEVERYMAQKIHTECGYDYSKTIDGCLNDKIKADTETADYREKEKEFLNSKSLKFNVSVFACVNRSHRIDLANVTIPRELIDHVNNFHQHYIRKYNSKKLLFDVGFGNAEVKMSFYGSNVQKQLNMSTIQMIVLLQFEGKSEITVGQIIQATKLPLIDVAKALNCFEKDNTPEAILIKKYGDNCNIELTDRFAINEEFNCAKKIITIKHLGKSKYTTAKVVKDIIVERDSEILAAIVRIMKQKKILTHQNLIAEISLAVGRRFVAEISSIKHRISYTLEHGFIKRSEADANVYEYIV
uniref:CULLIN_2 domain-containing protein n=1 Tax=Rhabditophanes sp. KR3021 TaxID=114890 RepID=A0AC35TRQ5_9BILA